MFFRKNISLLSLTLSAALAGGALLPAQTAYQLETLGIDDGLSQGYVGCLLQDREGFIWLGAGGFGVLKFNPRFQRFRCRSCGCFHVRCAGKSLPEN